MAPLLGEIIFEQPWNEPAGVGEIALIDNRTVLHATYHKDGSTRGYPIGARYLV
jgi:alpha-ketoglutarate-dependent taurine dioxygenase